MRRHPVLIPAIDRLARRIYSQDRTCEGSIYHPFSGILVLASSEWKKHLSARVVELGLGVSLHLPVTQRPAGYPSRTAPAKDAAPIGHPHGKRKNRERDGGAGHKFVSSRQSKHAVHPCIDEFARFLPLGLIACARDRGTQLKLLGPVVTRIGEFDSRGCTF